MPYPDKLLRIATSRWTERICFAAILLATQTHDARMRWMAGTAVALVVGTVIAGSIGPLREARRASRDFPHTPEYEVYARNRRHDADERNRHRIELD